MLGLRDYIWENTRFTVRSSAKHLTMFGLFGIALFKKRLLVWGLGSLLWARVYAF